MQKIVEIPTIAIFIFYKDLAQKSACENTWVLDAKKNGIDVYFVKNFTDIQNIFSNNNDYIRDFYYLSNDEQYIVIDNLIDYLMNFNDDYIYISSNHPDASGVILSKTLFFSFIATHKNDDFKVSKVDISDIVRSHFENTEDVEKNTAIMSAPIKKIKSENIRSCNMFGYKNYETGGNNKCCKFLEDEGNFEEMQKINKIISCGHMNAELMNEFYLYHQDKKDQNKKNIDNKWTFVTFFFDLSKYDKSTNRVSNKVSQYMEWAKFVLALKINLVIYCDPEYEERFLQERIKHKLENNTKIVAMNLSESEYYKYKEQIFDRKNIFSDNHSKYDKDFFTLLSIVYYTKFYCVNHAIKNQYFEPAGEPGTGGKHFYGWIDIGLYKTGGVLPHQLYRAMNIYREKCSFCYIDFTPRNIVNNLSLYYEYGRCNSAGGFFTGEKENMLILCELFKNKFLQHLQAGYLRAEEQILHPIHLENPDLFENYYGDYFSVVINYDKIRKDAISIINFYITKTRESSENALCTNACLSVLKAINEKTIVIPTSSKFKLFNELYISSFYVDKKIALQAVNHFMSMSQEKGFGQLFHQQRDSIINNINYIYPYYLQPVEKPVDKTVVKITYNKKCSFDTILNDSFIKYLNKEYKIIVIADVPLTHYAICLRELIITPDEKFIPNAMLTMISSSIII
jgi:hypothetical protein